MKKIVIVNSLYYPDVMGGAEISVKLLAEDLVNEGFDVSVICMGRDSERTKINGVNIYRIKEKNIYFMMDYYHQNALKKIKWHLCNLMKNPNKMDFSLLIDEIEPEVIISQNLLGLGSLVLETKKKYKDIKIIQTIRDYKIIEPTTNFLINKIAKVNFKRKVKNIDIFVGISKFSLSLFFKKANINSKSVKKEIIHNKVPNEKKINKLSKKVAKSVGFVGQITQEKGISIFLKAVSSLDIYTHLSSVIIVGEGPLLEDLKYKYKEFNKIVFLGKITHEEVKDIYEKLDTLVVPSIWEEPFGRVIIEAYRQKVNVLASDRGGIPEIIIDESYLFNPDNIENLKKKIFEKVIYNKGNDEEARKKIYEYSLGFVENVESYKEIIRRK